MIPQVLGGVGLFLIGMILTTDGLRAAAGDALRQVLLRFTGGPLKAMLSGAAVTALVQSSSATTLATIGFVGAGLLTFHQALGVIFGANLGTTATGWIVAGLGLKFSMSTLALPLVGVGALMRLLSRGRAQHFGLALAGFGIIFVGIDVLQEGMEGLATRLTPNDLPGDTFTGRLLLVGIGAVLTAVMQSSSAAMATTLTALHTETLSLEQAAAMVIGVNVGTTVTATIASIGASLAAKRTAVAHVLFNVVTGAIAFAMLPLFAGIVTALGDRVGPGDAAITLAVFHSVFNVVGIAVLLPFSRPFADFVVRVVADRGPSLTRHLDPNAADMANIAVEAVRRTAVDIAGEVFGALRDVLSRGAPSRAATERLEAAAMALEETKRYMAALRFIEQGSDEEHERHISTLHVLDHLGRLLEEAVEASATVFTSTVELREATGKVVEALSALLAWVGDPASPAPVESVRHMAAQLAEARQRERAVVLERTARAQITPAEADKQLTAMRRLDEIAYSLFRIVDRLRGERVLEPTPLPSSDTEPAPAEIG